ASSVPCERVFSSSKETDTLRRTCLLPVVVEILQLLKFMFRNDHLDFTKGLLSTEEELSVIDVSPDVIDELLSAGRIEELMALIDSSLVGSSESILPSN
ncbi:hypothetical protein B0H10DRAFT_1781918, partial [Mycena sp. CBHHK59/15]